MTTIEGSAGGSAAANARAKRQRAEKLLADADNWDKGARGEQIVARHLEELPAGFFTFHDLSIAGSRANVDHVVIGPTGVFVIDAKHYGGSLHEGNDMLWRGKFPIRHECETVAWEASKICDQLGHPVTPVLCFVGTCLPRPIHQIGQVAVCSADAVQSLVTHQRTVLTEPQIRQMCGVLRPSLRTSPSQKVVAARQRQPANRQRQPAKRNGAKKSLGAAGSLVCLVAAVAVVMIAYPSSNTPTTASPAAKPAAIAPVVTPLPFTGPILEFTCPTPGGGWVGTVKITDPRPDPRGFDMWWRGLDGQWTYWGMLAPPGSQPYSLNKLSPSAVVAIKAGRDGMSAVDQAVEASFTVPPTVC